MIIACPKCSGPFEIPNDQISPLTQVACPHCHERMIFDFEAANDASLVEPGHGSASGFATANDYHAAVGAGAITPAKQPTATAAPLPTPEPEPAPTPVVKAPEPEPEPVKVKAPEPEPVKVVEPEPVKAPEPEPVKVAEPEPEPAVAKISNFRPAEPEPEVPQPTKTERSAPHTPPTGDVVSKPPTEEAATPPEPEPAQSDSKPVAEEKQAVPPKPTEPEGGNKFLLFLVFAIVALVAATYVTKGSFNPMDLFK